MVQAIVQRRRKSMDGNTAAAYVSYAFTDVAAIYPITPSSDMAQHVDEWAAAGKKNIFGETVKVIEMQSEKGASGTVHGSLQSGALTSTYTSSQGLMLMIPNMFKIAGELLPGVFHVASRVVATNGLNINCDHGDIYAVRSTGFAILSSSSVQQVMDLAAVAHLSAIRGRVPFVHAFDGFRTSHEIQKIDVLEYSELAQLIDLEAVGAFRRNSLNPAHPCIRGGVQSTDIHFQQREVINKYWESLPDIVEDYMGEITKLTGRPYHPFNYYGATEAEYVIVAMGSMCQAIEETVDYLNAHGEKTGLIEVHLFRPFSLKHFFQSMPKSVKYITVLDRVKEINAQAEGLCMDVKTAFYNQDQRPMILGGRIGIGGKDIRPGHIMDVFHNMKQEQPMDRFTVGIVDDVNHISLPHEADPDMDTQGMRACKFWGLGSDGTVGANKSAIKIIGDNTDQYAQAFFAYDSKKSGGVTVSHLRFGNQPIRSTYLVDKADFISCSQQSYVHKYDILNGLKSEGILLLNTLWKPEELDSKLPAAMKQYILDQHIHLYTVNAVKISQDLGLRGRFNMVMQAAFFKLSDILPIEEALNYLKASVEKTYGTKGADVVAKNIAAIDAGVQEVIEIDTARFLHKERDNRQPVLAGDVPAYIKKFLIPVNRMEGDNIPVSTMLPMEDGSYPPGASAYEKRGVAVMVPHWDAQKCIQCNQCAFVCPHGCIRPILTTPEENVAAPAGYVTKSAIGAKEYSFHISISVLDCTGCGNCVNVCPAREKALAMNLLSHEAGQAEIFAYDDTLPQKKNPFNRNSVKGSQFEKTFFAFNGACAGCGETPYIKLVTQLFGDRMLIANSAGCAHVFISSIPGNPLMTNAKGYGPAWQSSLFEDTAEFGLGLRAGSTQIRQQIAGLTASLMEENLNPALTEACREWLDGMDVSQGTQERAENLEKALASVKDTHEQAKELYRNKDYFVKVSNWCFTGDGGAYDIDYDGLDHVLAMNENINILLLDTEVYSNTGGQASKATHRGAIAKFAAAGKRVRRKDLGRIAMTYGHIYVAQIAIGADKNQALKAILEAEAYDGPSLIICYCPCINHGIKTGMGCSQEESRLAVECGYWPLYRYNPDLKTEGKNPFILDSKEPAGDFRDFLMNEVRYASLYKKYPEAADALFEATKQDSLDTLSYYKAMANHK